MRLDDDLKYFEEPEFKEILEKYEAAREAGQAIYMDAEDLTDVAEYYSLVMHDDERADDAIALARQLHPDAVNPQVFKARQFMQDGNLATAEKLCNAIEDQQDREVYFLRAELLIRQDRTSEARTMLLEIAEEVEEDRDFFLYDSAYVFVDYRQFDTALHFANLLETIAPKWYKTWQVKADTSLGLEAHEEALTYINQMLDVDPFCAETWNWSAEAYCGLLQYDDAVSSADYALAVEPDNERALQLKAWALLQQGNFADAHQLYRRLIKMTPDSEQNWLYDSYCLLDAEDVDGALAAIERAESLAGGISPDQLNIYEQHAQILSRQGEVEQALTYIDRAEEFFLPDNDVLDLDLLRARIFAENEHPERAVDYIGSACQRHEELQLEIVLQGAVLMMDCGYYEMAQNMFQELLQYATTDEQRADYYAYMSYCAYNLPDDEAALKFMSLAMPAEARLRELFAEEFPGVLPSEYYDYFFFQIHGRWPQA